MKVKTLDGREYDLQQATLDSLRMLSLIHI